MRKVNRKQFIKWHLTKKVKVLKSIEEQKWSNKHLLPNKKQIKKIVGIISGKGGFGKSTVTFLTTIALNRCGYRVGILDADITGSSIGYFFNLGNALLEVRENKIIPLETADKIKVMAMSLLLEDQQQAVIWRGPLLSRTVEQFYADVLWGELDYLLIDMPPGTSDVALTAMQKIPFNGLLMVSTPHRLVEEVVVRTLQMAEKLSVQVLGIIENMSYFICSHCLKKSEPFANPAGEKNSNRMYPVLFKLPVRPDLASISVQNLKETETELFKIIDELGHAVLRVVS